MPGRIRNRLSQRRMIATDLTPQEIDIDTDGQLIGWLPGGPLALRHVIQGRPGPPFRLGLSGTSPFRNCTIIGEFRPGAQASSHATSFPQCQAMCIWFSSVRCCFRACYWKKLYEHDRRKHWLSAEEIIITHNCRTSRTKMWEYDWLKSHHVGWNVIERWLTTATGITLEKCSTGKYDGESWPFSSQFRARLRALKMTASHNLITVYVVIRKNCKRASWVKLKCQGQMTIKLTWAVDLLHNKFTTSCTKGCLLCNLLCTCNLLWINESTKL